MKASFQHFFDETTDVAHTWSWSTKFFMATLQNTSDHSLDCPTFRVDHHRDLHHLIIFSSRQFVARLLVQGRLQCLGQLS
jgi:hypothetical protein